MNIGIIGAGSIATFIMKEVQQMQLGGLKVKSLFVRNFKKYEQLATDYGVQLFDDIDQFLESDIDIVVEAANIATAHQHVPKVLEKKEVIIISIGALANEAFLEEVQLLGKKHKRSIYLPSGAIGGIDAIQNANGLGELKKVLLTTRKPAHSFGEDVVGEKVIFQGSAAEAIEKFPKNINVSIVLSLAGIGVKNTKVEIIADSKVTKNHHQIQAEGTFGSMTFQIENEPMRTNPNTSMLAALSVLGTLKKLQSTIKIGL
ncbi:aspartate dehydrogenase [Sporosarcina sp. P3]|uniref:aspartate dehydrogenase n=1 Tax=Sporosarcina sp. P3 TaxID=2048245 RepID=UPI000C16A4EF|nr:aspartate dehydrogenase [Sporosarcina sp. P3]PID23191.1 aspartate dehydrogenase [Sporosarcina sp. P3]